MEHELDQQIGETLNRTLRSRLWFPHLLIRGTSGDTGKRPLWEPMPCWVSRSTLTVQKGIRWMV